MYKNEWFSLLVWSLGNWQRCNCSSKIHRLNLFWSCY
jgi:hypothetical protein